MSRKPSLVTFAIALVLISLSLLIREVTVTEDQVLLEEELSVPSWGWENLKFTSQGRELTGRIKGEGPLRFTAYIDARTVEYQGEIFYDWAAEKVTEAEFAEFAQEKGLHTLSIYNPNRFSITVHAKVTETRILRPYSPLSSGFLILSACIFPAGLALVLLSRKTRKNQ